MRPTTLWRIICYTWTLPVSILISLIFPETYKIMLGLICSHHSLAKLTHESNYHTWQRQGPLCRWWLVTLPLWDLWGICQSRIKVLIGHITVQCPRPLQQGRTRKGKEVLFLDFLSGKLAVPPLSGPTLRKAKLLREMIFWTAPKQTSTRLLCCDLLFQKFFVFKFFPLIPQTTDHIIYLLVHHLTLPPSCKCSKAKDLVFLSTTSLSDT